MSEDKGEHYRYSYKGVKLDPYRVCKIYGVPGGPREHIIKKALRGASKGHTEVDVIAELQSCLDRWKEMLAEDADEPEEQVPAPFNPMTPKWMVHKSAPV